MKNWEFFNIHKGQNQVLPKVYRLVLVQKTEEEPFPIMVGYLRYAAGDKQSPYFVTPGKPTSLNDKVYWCDCLGDNFYSPKWNKKK